MALSLNGTSQYVNATATAGINGITNKITVASWINRQGSGNVQTVIARPISLTSNQMWVLSYRNSKASFGITTSGVSSTTYASQGQLVNPGAWHHLCGTWDGSTITIYFDGAQVGTASKSGSLPNDTTPLCIGAEPNAVLNSRSNYLGGWVDGIRLYNRVLTPNEILTMYTLQGSHGIVHGMVGWWPMNEGAEGASVTALADASDQGSVSTPVNSPIYTNSILSFTRRVLRG